jgi:hypothetical protein
MRKALTCFAFLTVVLHSFGQAGISGTGSNMIMFSAALNKLFINNSGFNNWTALNYNKTEPNGPGVSLDIALVTRRFDGGLYFDVASANRVANFYFGKRLTPRQAAITSYLNLEVGQFGSFYNDIAPPNFVPPAGYQGKSLQLQYNAAYFGLESKNYFNFLSFRSGTGKKRISYNSGFYCQVGYEPWGGGWQYGYYTGSGKYAVFHGSHVSGIPSLNNLFFNTGVFFGIGS